MQTETFTIPGMTTELVAQRVAAALSEVEGVSAIKLSLAGQRTAITFDETQTSGEVLGATLLAAGFDVAPGGACCGGCCGS
ncbi:heavy-metal-associated domain-containing protein [Massilia sp. TS11]|uniref:heavy-metal-associated domain-containing protein n=1 Tax=Massilia sp. TS11 TaxID=2908003 RepID=UPI001EDC076A|nr:heavy-metal-associated domain-containing protein [Massilia sp. TS11]MCG2585952.1 heavy-metal-associated domain-containing protein [Massilia sp. TS11]